MTAKQKAARAKFKAIVKEASKLRKKNPKLTQAQAVKQAWAISYGKKRAGVGAVKKKAAKKKAATKKKAAPKKKTATNYHKDTKSHNVNIRVMSGTDDFVTRNVNAYKKLLEDIKEWQKKYKSAKDPGIKYIYKLKLDRLKFEARERKFVVANYIKQLKKIK